MDIQHNAVPVLRLTIPQRPTIKILAVEILMALGARDPGTGTTNSMTRRITQLAHEAKTREIVIDNIQELFVKHQRRALQPVAGWLRVLSERCNIALIISTPKSADMLRATYPQLLMYSKTPQSTTQLNLTEQDA